MKRLFKKNQMIITALALMIAIAGYLNYSGRLFGDKSSEASSETANQELLDISEEDLETAGDIESLDSDVAEGEVEGTPGEAVLTNGDATGVIAEAKVSRETVRSQNKETLQGIIDSDQISEAEKEDAIAQLLSMTEIAEKEVAAETLLASKGFVDSVVSISSDGVDIVVDATELDDAQRAQIEDIIIRKTGVSAENIVISPVHSGTEAAAAEEE